MLVSSILKCGDGDHATCDALELTLRCRIFYWFGAYYSFSLLIQAVLMILVQSILLKVALDNRPASGMREGLEHAPFSAYNQEGILHQLLSGKRPYQFWQWPTARPYVGQSPLVEDACADS